ncbi:MAG TPA: hypothetical protein VHY83_08540 [Solirubrobacteraceae bacterium]|jgi:hypothetical protein|nr:hypothetical protein [Solirubrobacteraceae bacterium]
MSRATAPALKTKALVTDNDGVSPLVTLWIVLSPFVVIGCLKGRYALSLVGLVVLFGIPAILAATRLARADSWWAKRYYDDEKLSRVAERYRSGSGINKALTL